MTLTLFLATLTLVLALLIEGKEYDLYIDASHHGLGVVLIQKGKVIAHAFWQLKDYKIDTLLMI